MMICNNHECFFKLKKKVHIIENNGVIPNVIIVMYFGNLLHRDQFAQNPFVVLSL